MTFTWRFLGPDDQPLAGGPVAPAHGTQSDAESWLGEHWRELADDGVAAATLLDADVVVYGPMPLAAS